MASFLEVSPSKPLCISRVCHTCHMLCPSHSSDLITRIISGEECKGEKGRFYPHTCSEQLGRTEVKLYSFFNLSSRLARVLINATPRLPYPPRRDPVPIVQEAGWAPRISWAVQIVQLLVTWWCGILQFLADFGPPFLYNSYIFISCYMVRQSYHSLFYSRQ